MDNRLLAFAERYAAALRQYLSDPQEAGLAEAYELGRLLLVQGFGVLDIARIHHHSLEAILTRRRSIASDIALGEAFYLDALSSFETTQRGFREANAQLNRLIATLEQRNTELAETNCRCAIELAERKRTEAALRRSEAHFRELFGEARRMEANLRKLSSQILHAQEAERKRISRELHDEVGQGLTAVSVTLAAVPQRLGRGSRHARRKLAEAQQLIRDTMEAVHAFARDLRPTLLDELGLLPALRSLLNSFAERTGLRVRFEGDARAERLDDGQKIVLFRVAQESLTNIARHAREATWTRLAIRSRDNGICMTVADNGCSFKLDREQFGQGHGRLGLLGMEERVRLVNGRFSVKATPGKGTTVRVVVPLEK